MENKKLTAKRTHLLAILVLAALGRAAIGQEPVRYVTGEEFWRRLDRSTGIFWMQVPFRDGLLRLGQTHQVAIVLDRRCDPDRKTTLTVRDRPLRFILQEAAKTCPGDIALLPPVIYVGPAESAWRLPLLAEVRREEAKRLGGVAGRGLAAQAVSWPRLTVPAQLLEQWTRDAGWELTNARLIPHDLWPAGELPPLPLTDRLTLLLIQFDLTFVMESPSRVKLLPIPADFPGERRFAVAGSVNRWAESCRQAVPDCRVTVMGDELVVRGPVESLKKLSAVLDSVGNQNLAASPAQNTQPDTGTVPSSPDPFLYRRFTIREGRGTLQGVIQQLARQLNMELQFDAEGARQAGIPLDKPISFHVQNGTVDELWTAVLEPHGLTFRRNGRTLSIFPKPR